MKKISSQLVVITIICILITGVVIGSLSVWQSIKSVRGQAEESLLTQAESYAKQLERITAETEMLVSDANVIITESANQSDLDQELDAFISNTRDVIRIMAGNVDFNTNLYATLIPEYAKGDKLVNLVYMREGDKFVFTELPWYVDKMEDQAENLVWFNEPIRLGRGYWTDVYYDPNIQLWMVSYCEPIKTNNGIIGVVGMDVNFEILSGIIREAQFYESGYASLVDKEEYFLSHPVYEHTDNLNTVANGQLKNLAQIIKVQDSGILAYSLNGVKKITGFAQVEDQFTVFTTISEAEAMAAVYLLRNRIVLVILAVTLLMVLFAYLIGRHIARPIEMAADLAKNITHGDFDTTLSVDVMSRQDEIGVLGKTLTEMTKSLKNMMAERDAVLHELEVTNLELEKRVQVRTSELERLNRELKETLEHLTETQFKLFRAEKLSTLIHMISGLAHEINTPIGICITSVTYLTRLTDEIWAHLRELDASHTESRAYASEVRDAARLIENNLNSMVHLIDRLKIYSQIKNPNEKDCFNACDILKEIYANSIKSLGHNQEITIECSENIEICGDSKGFVVVMNILIDNALVHGFEKQLPGEIIITGEVKESGVEIVFTDTGKGIDAEKSAHIFDPFFTTKRGRENTGLGLFTAYEIMTLHFDGEIALDLDYTEGSRFILRFLK